VTRQRGFSLVEAIVATALMLVLGALLLQFAAASQRAARIQPEEADVVQRLRAAVGTLERDLRSAGAAAAHGSLGTLSSYFPPLVPARTGLFSPDVELSAFQDRLTIFTTAEGAWPARLTGDMATADADIPIDGAAPGCPGSGICGLAVGTRAAIVDTERLGAGYDLFTVTHLTAEVGHAAPNPRFSKPYRAATARVVPIGQKVYYLDRPGRRLMVYDGFRTALPVVDGVADLQFTYLADPDPRSVAAPADGGGNCAYTATDPPVPLLAPLGPALVDIPAASLTDGPLCGVAPNRFDADLLRVRRVRVRLRVQASTADVRDVEIAFHVAPRNMVAAR
jgi:type II secretory pathway pseudopilin PulG